MPKPMTPFFLNIFQTNSNLSEGALKNVEYATSDFLQLELSSVFQVDPVLDVQVKILQQERVIHRFDENALSQQSRSRTNGAIRRKLRSVPGSKLLVHVNVTFDQEPSPNTSNVDNSLQTAMVNLSTLVNNITATEDPELGYVFIAYREEIDQKQANPTVSEQQPVTKNTERNSVNYIVPIALGFVLFGAVIAVFVIRRRRRRIEAANQKVQEDMAFLDEESNVFSFENSPSKSSARKKELMSPRQESYGADESSWKYSTSQGSMSQSPLMGSPTKSYLSGASTVKVSNARIMPLPSKLTELASTSLFAFSEEDEYLDSENEANSSQRAETPASLQQSEGSHGSSLDRILDVKSEDILSIENSPRHAPAQASSNKSAFSSLFSSHFFSAAASQLTTQVDNTADALRKKAARNGGRSFSLSPKKQTSPPPSTTTRAKSEAGDIDDEDSVFDFLHTSPAKKEVDADLSTSSANDISGHDIKSLNRVLDVDADGSGNASNTKSPASPEISKSNNSSRISDGDYSKRSAAKKSPTKQIDDAQNIWSDEDYDSLSDEDIHGSFPRRSRRHAKSTTQDGTYTYQANAMQPQDWSLTDDFSDDETLSTRGGSANGGAFPKPDATSPRSHQKGSDTGAKSPTSAQSRSSYSAVTQNSQSSKADNTSQASASRQLINDLVWLSKKIAGVKKSAVDSAPGLGDATVPALGAPPPIEPVDSLSYASQDGLISPTSTAPPNSASKERSSSQAPTPSNSASTTASCAQAVNSSILCRDCYAPPGKLNIVIHSTKDGPAVHEVKEGSCLEGSIFPGDLIISVDDVDTRAFTAAQLMKMMAEKSQMKRKITVLHFEEAEQREVD